MQGPPGDSPEWEALPHEQRAALIDDFVATSGLLDDDVIRSLADRKVALDAEQRASLARPLIQE